MNRHVSRTAAALLLVFAAACSGDAPSDDAAAPARDAAEDAARATGTAMTEDAATSGLLNPNDAPAQALAALPSMTADLADAVAANRPFADMLEVDALLAGSLDEATREELYRALFLPLDLNNASEEEIMLIPGVGSRMAHEFDEYRPYEAMARFRAEIGKYVDEDEVARLEQYVEIR